MSISRLFRIFYYIFLVFLGAVAVLLIVSVLPITGNYKVMVVQSGSMEPAIKTGSIVVVKPAEEYKIGDVITFGAHTKIKAPTTHRIYDIRVIEGEPRYITKGDANEEPDAKEVLSRDIIGKVLFHIPYVGFAVEAAKKPVGFMLIICVPAALIIGDEIRKIIAEVKKRKEIKS